MSIKLAHCHLKHANNINVYYFYKKKGSLRLWLTCLCYSPFAMVYQRYFDRQASYTFPVCFGHTNVMRPFIPLFI